MRDFRSASKRGAEENKVQLGVEIETCVSIDSPFPLLKVFKETWDRTIICNQTIASAKEFVTTHLINLLPYENEQDQKQNEDE